jgi:hypothetical protein
VAWLLITSGLVRQGLVIIRKYWCLEVDLTVVTRHLYIIPVAPESKVISENNDSEQRTQIQKGVRGVEFLSCF